MKIEIIERNIPQLGKYRFCIHTVGMPPTPFWMSSLHTTNIGRIERVVVMGCVLDVVGENISQY